MRYVRFFCYWNDEERVDVDLHARAVDLCGSIEDIGWNSHYYNNGIVFSGDITHSDAAEYIDVDLAADVSRVAFNINLYAGRESFGEVQTCFTGLMAVNDVAEDVQLYDPANCFFTRQLRSACSNMQYGYLDVQNRMLVFDGKPMEDVPDAWYRLDEHPAGRMTVKRYLELLLTAQGCQVAEHREDAETVMVIGKASEKNELSLIDNHYFMDA